MIDDEGIERDRNGRDADMLTRKQRLFVEAMIGPANFNSAEAARQAGYSHASANYIGHENMSKPHIADAIAQAMADRVERTRVDSTWVLTRLVAVEAEATALTGKRTKIAALRVRKETLDSIGKHVDVRAFRTQLGLSNPSGGPIEMADAAALAQLSDEELDTLERARAILDRTAGGASHPLGRGDPSGEGAASESA